MLLTKAKSKLQKHYLFKSSTFSLKANESQWRAKRTVCGSGVSGCRQISFVALYKMMFYNYSNVNICLSSLSLAWY